MRLFVILQVLTVHVLQPSLTEPSLYGDYYYQCMNNSNCYSTPSSLQLRNWTGAQQWCSDHYSSLAVIDRPTAQTDVVSFLLGIPTSVLLSASFVYINGQAGGFATAGAGSTPTWLNVDSYFSSPFLSGQVLVYSDSTSHVYIRTLGVVGNPPQYGTYASTTTIRYICQFVSWNQPGQADYVYNNNYFVAYIDTFTWYNARDQCLSLGGDLASLGALGTDWSWLNAKTSIYIQYWIGLRNTWWSSLNPRGAFLGDVKYTQWKDTFPTYLNTMQCIALDNTPGRQWTNVDCTTQSRFVCSNKTTMVGPIPPPFRPIPSSIPSTTTVSTPTSFKLSGAHTSSSTPRTLISSTISDRPTITASQLTTKEVDSKNIGIGVGVGVGGLVLIAVIVFLVCCWRTKKKRNAEQNHVGHSLATVGTNKTVSASRLSTLDARTVGFGKHPGNYPTNHETSLSQVTDDESVYKEAIRVKNGTYNLNKIDGSTENKNTSVSDKSLETSVYDQAIDVTEANRSNLGNYEYVINSPNVDSKVVESTKQIQMKKEKSTDCGRQEHKTAEEKAGAEEMLIIKNDMYSSDRTLEVQGMSSY